MMLEKKMFPISLGQRYQQSMMMCYVHFTPLSFISRPAAERARIEPALTTSHPSERKLCRARGSQVLPIEDAMKPRSSSRAWAWAISGLRSTRADAHLPSDWIATRRTLLSTLTRCARRSGTTHVHRSRGKWRRTATVSGSRYASRTARSFACQGDEASFVRTALSERLRADRSRPS